MSRQIDQATAMHFINGNNAAVGNTMCLSEHQGDGTHTVKVYLHGHLIAQRKTDSNTIKISLAGYNTMTTKARLHGILERYFIPYRFKTIQGQIKFAGLDIEATDWISINTENIEVKKC